MKSTLAVLAVTFLVSKALAQNPSAYNWLTESGKKTSWSSVMKAAAGADIILFGEQHDDPIAHWFQFLLLEQLHQENEGKVSLGMEMLERDLQWAIDLFVTGLISADELEDTTRMWSNFHTDYLPALQFARDNKIQVIATNIPRRYASMVFKKGEASLDTLPETVKAWMTPLPFVVDTSLSQYRQLVQMGIEMHANGLNFAKAQAIKDATMAHFILANWKPGDQVLHFNGAFHSDFDQSIVWYLQQSNPTLKILTISTVSQDDVRKLDPENRGKADFILVTPTEMTRTM